MNDLYTKITDLSVNGKLTFYNWKLGITGN